MKKIIHSIIIFLLLFGCSSSNNLRIVTNDRGERVALGEYNANQLLENFPQFKKNYLSYQPDTLILKNIIRPKEKVEIFIINGTWCSDSRREVPRFIKIIEYFDDKNIKLRFIGVDRTKRDEKGIADKLKIELIPTFVFFSRGNEIGRIIEMPQITLEEDLMEILNSISSYE